MSRLDGTLGAINAPVQSARGGNVGHDQSTEEELVVSMRRLRKVSRAGGRRGTRVETPPNSRNRRTFDAVVILLRLAEARRPADYDNIISLPFKQDRISNVRAIILP